MKTCFPALIKGLCLLAVLLSPALLQSQEQEPLRVGLRQVPPFSIKKDNGQWEGLTSELWDNVASELGLEYEWVEADSVGELLTLLENGSIDVIASGISITTEREKTFDFCHPFLSSNLAILARQQEVNRWGRLLRSLFSLPFLAAASSLAFVLLAAGAAIYFFERRHNPEQFSPKPVKGLGDAFWWSAVTMTTVGYGDKAPVSLGGRLVALVWMFLSVIILSTFTAGIVSSLALPSQVATVDELADMRSGEIATVKGTTSDALILDNHLEPVYVNDPAGIPEAMEEGRLKGLLFDKPTLQYYMKHLDDAYYLVDLPRNREEYSFVLQEDSPLREAINLALLDFLGDPAWFELKTQYLD